MMIYNDLSTKVLDAVYTVHRALGPGLLENNYHNALWLELREMGFRVDYNRQYDVFYKHQVVGEYFADLVVEDKIILELKAVQALSNVHIAQLLNYLRISGCRVGYLINCSADRVVFKRMAV